MVALQDHDHDQDDHDHDIEKVSPSLEASPNSKLWSTLHNNRIFQDVPGDVTVIVDGQSFLLHKFPLVTRSGKIRKMIAESKDDLTISMLELFTFPGGPQSFELAAKFCYGMNFEITQSNVANLRCVAEFLEMTEEYHEANLVAKTEAYLNGVVVHSLAKSLEVLLSCESLPRGISEDVSIPRRCVDGIAQNTSVETDWWVEDLSSLKLSSYKNVISDMVKQGVRETSVIASLIHYAQVWLTSNDGAHEHEKKVTVEAIVDLLPSDNSSEIPLPFLLSLLRMGVTVDASISCRLELERRVGSRLDMVSLDDLLIPLVHKGNSSFDNDTICRIVVNFLQGMDEDVEDEDEDEEEECGYDSQGFGSPRHESLLKVGRLFDSYLAEVSPDPNLSLQKFTSLFEILPDYARVIDDGLYRALDIYLKAHPMVTEDEKKKLCKYIDCRKLSEEASNHAAQNDRLPVHMTVRVLYFEQLRMKNSLCESAQIMSSDIPSAAMSPKDTYAFLRRENRELKLQISRLRMKKEMVDKPGNGKTFLASLSKGIGKMGIFGLPLTDKRQNPVKTVRGRRYSIS